MIYEVNPITDRRWENFVARHPHSSIFHTPGWLLALQRTYGYEPVVYTTSPPGEELTNGLPFCQISSWITGRRLVSLPFSDHCDPLLGDGSSGADLFEELGKKLLGRNWRYIEVRPRRRGIVVLQDRSWSSESYCFHAINLERDLKTIYASFHKDCVQRKIRRADREKMRYTEGRTASLLRMFYDLFVRNRQRQRVPPQPFRWFVNLAECLGPAMQVRVALQGERVAASIVTLEHQKTLVYKYGCSDARLNNLGGMSWLFWKAVQKAKSQDLKEMDLGRSSWDNQGLIVFKDHLGGKRLSLNYWKKPPPAPYFSVFGALRRPAGWIFGHAPLPVLTMTGNLLYRHFG
jgi:CelD/BcsL family acetyltransferase involved in cellulose biosynthesis